MIRKTAFRFHRSKRGSTTVEFAIVASMFIMLVVGVLAVGYTFVVRSDIENSLLSAERYALIHDETDAALASHIRSKLVTYKSSNLTLSFSRASADGVNFVKASVSYTVDLGVRFAFGPVTISSTRIFPT